MNLFCQNRIGYLNKWLLISTLIFSVLVIDVQAQGDNDDIINTRANIILIMTDDQGIETLGAYGSAAYDTPALDKLAEKGVKFTNMHAQPLCTPSRVKIMTGKYNYRNYTDFGYLNPDEKTFGNILQDADYSTLIAGKWQLNGIYGDKKPGWDDINRPHHFGFDEYILWQLTKDKTAGERYANPLLVQNGRRVWARYYFELCPEFY